MNLGKQTRVRLGKILHAELNTLYFLLIAMGTFKRVVQSQCGKGGTEELMLIQLTTQESFFFFSLFEFLWLENFV